MELAAGVSQKFYEGLLENENRPLLGELDVLQTDLNLKLDTRKFFIELVLTGVSIGSLFINIYFSSRNLVFIYDENDRAMREFELRTRPFLIVDNIEGNTDLSTKESSFRLFIKNTGTMPAKIVSQAMDCPSQDSPSYILKNDIVGAGQSIVHSVILRGIEESVCTFDIKYHSAIANFSKVEYETNQKIIYKFGEKIGSDGGFMK